MGKEEMDIDVEIYNQRVLLVLNKTVTRVKLASLLINSTDEERTKLWEMLSQELQLQINEVRERFAPNDRADTVKEATNQQGDLELSKIILLLENYDYFTEMVSKENFQMTETFSLFIKCLHELSVSVECHQKENAVQEKLREKHLKRFKLRNEQAKKEITNLEEELVAKKRDLNANLIAKNLLIHRYETKMERIKKVTQEAIHKRVTESQCEIQAAEEASDELKETLQQDLADGTSKYDSLLHQHLTKEKELRVQRTKIENQLAAWMQKFDQDMFERQAEEEKLLAAYEGEKKKMDEIQRKLDEQEEEYDELMQEKAAYEQEVLEQKLFIFILNRSARRIQRAFRAYKLHKMTKKKKGKKGKGKKK